MRQRITTALMWVNVGVQLAILYFLWQAHTYTLETIRLNQETIRIQRQALDRIRGGG